MSYSEDCLNLNYENYIDHTSTPCRILTRATLLDNILPRVNCKKKKKAKPKNELELGRTF